VRRVSAVLFDLDGVLVESRESTERAWLAWASKNQVDEAELRAAMHGVRSADVVRALRPDLDAVAEAGEIERRQAEDVDGLRAVLGAVAALRALKGDRVAVVTSGTRPLALARLAAAGVEPPAVVVFAGDVERGKPDPEGYLTAARRLGVDPAEALVVEDAPQGIEAAKAAGAATVGVTSTHAAEELGGADFVLGSLEELPELLATRFDAAAVLAP
jgi:mannitol-1-/sugar-/sorbitol-6-phosphatase